MQGACLQNSSNLGCLCVLSRPECCNSIFFFLSLKDPWHDPGILWISSLPGW